MNSGNDRDKVQTFQNLVKVGNFWKLVCTASKFLKLLPTFYVGGIIQTNANKIEIGVMDIVRNSH